MKKCIFGWRAYLGCLLIAGTLLSTVCVAAAGRQGQTIPAYDCKSFVSDVARTATGFFRVEEIEENGVKRWWVIDPKGRGMVLLGIDHVKYHGHWCEKLNTGVYLETNRKMFPNKSDWETNSLERLEKWGFNLLGAGCDEKLAHRGFSHTKFLNMGDGFCTSGIDEEVFICPNEKRPCSAFPNVFHPKFADWCERVAKEKCAANRNDPWLFGYFIDNELSWWGRGYGVHGLFNEVMKLSDGHSAKKALKNFLQARGVGDSVTDEDKLAFLVLVAEKYFSTTTAAIRRHDPNHLVMGARFAGLDGGAHDEVWRMSGKYCDVVTFNCYPWADIDRNVVCLSSAKNSQTVAEAFARRYDIVKKPILITEWSFPALDSGLPCRNGGGQRFYTQRERTQASELFAKTLLSLPFVIGYDYFMWVDEPALGISGAFPEDSNYGLVTEQGEPYREITEMFARVQKDVGRWRRAPLPQQRASTKKPMMAADARRTFKTGEGVVFSQTGSQYKIRNAAGLRLKGSIGGKEMFESVELNGRRVGSYNAMLNFKDGKGASVWRDAGRVTAVSFREGDGTVVVTSEGEAAGRRFALTHAVTLASNQAKFLCEVVKLENLGKEQIEVEAFYFRQYADYAKDKKGIACKDIPNLWNRPMPMRDFWMRTDGLFYGGMTEAPTATMFSYYISRSGSVHPDAKFSPSKKLVVEAGESVELTDGSVWMVGVCGAGGPAEWLALDDGVGKL